MNLHPATQKALAQVEEKTGLPVIVNPDPSIGTLASVKIARYGAPAHVVNYNPHMGHGIDYAVCCQCGYILRAFGPPEGERFDFGMTYWGRRETEKLLTERLRAQGLSFPKEVRSQLRDKLFDGMMLQLRSVPVGLRVDAWIGREHPDLAEQQKASVSRQVTDNIRSLTPEVRKIAPEKIFAASMGMNAAFAAYWSKAWNDPLPLAPYRETGLLATGEALLTLWNDVPDDSANDRKLIDAWGECLGLQGWYEFLPVGGTGS